MKLTHSLAGYNFNLSIVPYIVSAIVVLLVGFSGFILWLSLAPLSSASIAPGKLVTSIEKQAIQHNSGGVVDELLVNEGDFVKKGEKVLTLSDPILASQLQQLRQSLFISQSRLARVNAEISNRPIIWQSDDDDSLTISERHIRRDQIELLLQNREIHQNKVASAKQQIRQVVNDQDSYKAWIKSDTLSLQLLGEELEAKQKLLEKGFISKIAIQELKREQSTLQAKLKEHNIKVKQTSNKIRELNSNLDSLKRGFVRDARQEKDLLIAEIQEIEQQLTATRLLSDRVDLRAPVSGEVINLAIHTQGGVIAPGSVVMEIVPEHSPIIAHVNIHPRDIESVYEGLKASVRLSSFNFRQVPPISGELIHVSADSIFNERLGDQIYQGKVTLDTKELVRHGIEIKPGMPVEAQIILEERTVLDYLLSPLLDVMEKGMREA